MGTVFKIIDNDFEDSLEAVLAVLRTGGIFIYPTDSVYGIGGDATSRNVVEKIHKVKGTEPHKPMSVMFSDFQMLEEYCETGLWEDMVLEKYLPGPFTFVVKERIRLPVSETDRLGIRIPDNSFCQTITRMFGNPIVTTSANFHGLPPPSDFRSIDKKLIDKVMVALDAGPTKYGKSSTVIDLVGKKMIRESGEIVKLMEE